MEVIAAISENRARIMGVCMGIIMLYHHPFSSIFPNWIWILGSLGVDVFLFLSGFGLYFSLKKREESNQTILSFYKRRFVRIMPAAIIAGIGLSWNGEFGELRDILIFSGLGLWYIRAILILYVFSPLFYWLVVRSKYRSIMLIFVICEISVVFLALHVFVKVYDIGNMTFTWTLARTPAFIAGMLIAAGSSLAFNSKIINFIVKICCAALACALISIFVNPLAAPVWKKLGLYFGWFLFAFCIPELCMLFVRFISLLPVKVKAMLQWMGEKSLELYLVHETIYAYVNEDMPASCLVRWGSMVLISFIAAWLLNKICANLKFWRLFRKSKKTCTNS